MEDLIYAGQQAGFKRFPLMAALLVTEKYTLRELGFNFLVMAHYSVPLPGVNNTSSTRPYLLGFLRNAQGIEVLTALRIRDNKSTDQRAHFVFLEAMN